MYCNAQYMAARADTSRYNTRTARIGGQTHTARRAAWRAQGNQDASYLWLGDPLQAVFDFKPTVDRDANARMLP